jgi:hypothetical protein
MHNAENAPPSRKTRQAFGKIAFVSESIIRGLLIWGRSGFRQVSG